MVEKKFSMFICPSCNGSMIYRNGDLYCKECSEKITIVEGIPYFSADVTSGSSVNFFDLISSIYETPVWFPLIYKIISGPLSPIDDRKYIAKLVDLKGKDVLDVACGTGRFTRYIAEELKFILGIDISRKMLKKAKKYSDKKGIENILFARMDAYNLYLKNNFFDLVSCCWALHLFRDITKTLKEIYRVLKLGGDFIGTTLINKYILSSPYIQEWIRKNMGVYVFEKKELINQLSNIGFSDIYTKERGATVFFRGEK